MRGFLALTSGVLIAIAVGIAAVSGASSNLSITRVPQTLSANWGSGTNPFSPAWREEGYCSWRDGIPFAQITLQFPTPAPRLPSTACNPILPGKTFGIFEAPTNGHLDDEVLREAHLNLSHRTITVGPVLLTFDDGSGARPTFAVADGSLWAYDNSLAGTEVLRFSLEDGALLQRITIPPMGRPILAANADGLWLGESNQSSVDIPIGVYLVRPGATQVQIVQSTKDYVWAMSGSGHTMDIVEGVTAGTPTEQYRVTVHDD